MSSENPNEIFTPRVPELNLEEHGEMLSEFTTEVLDLLIEAKNAVLALETVPNDKESLNKAFKVFYTIKGLATFLNLSDIQHLAKVSEGLFDSLRKELLPFDDVTLDAAMEAIDSLRALLDLLNDQIANHGHLTKEYIDISAVVLKIQALNESAIPGSIRKVIDDKRAGKMPLVSLPVSVESDSRVKILKRQQELIRERELAIRLSQQAQKMAAEKSDMLASMSHEMRTLINAIMGFSDLLVKGDLEEKQKIFLHSIRSSAELLLDIINNILDLAKIERGKLKLETIGFNLRSLVESVFQIIRARLEGKQISLFFNIDPEIPLGLKGDPTRFRQILLNLLGNAVKFTEKGEVGLTVSLDPYIDSNSTAMDRSRAYLRFKVSDTGIGISGTKIKYIFEPFMQGDKTIAREYGGTGLGLAISKSYIETMGGKIWVESSVGQGSDFIFQVSFPIDDALTQEAEQDAAQAFDLAAGKKAVVIDRDKRRDVEQLCRLQKMQITSYAQASEEVYDLLCIEAQKGNVPDIILVDLIGYRDEAYLLANKLQQDKKFDSAKIIAVTSDIKIGVSNEAYKACFDDYLLRPAILDEFINLLQKTFGAFSHEEGVGHGPEDGMSCSGINVLIVDDSMTNIELIKAYFESIECNGDFAMNGQEAIEKIKQKRYDICFMDLQMPVMNGFAATQIIRSDISRDLPIIALTAADAPEDKEKCQEVGFTDFLAKPFNMNDFRDKIISYGRNNH